MKHISLAAAVLVASASHSYAECYSADRTTDALVVLNPDASVRARLTGEEAAAFIMQYNSLPPQTSHEADEVLILRPFTRSRIYLIGLFNEGCRTSLGHDGIKLVDRLLGQVGYGEGA